jgi:periplasmic divalent cation tolerance protein
MQTWPRGAAFRAPVRLEKPGMDDLVILYTTWPDAETAGAVGRLAVERKLAACANVLGPMLSIYRWDGAVQNETETPMLLKTTSRAANRLKALIIEQHPYATPCILALKTDPGGHNPGYVTWACSEVD